MCHLKFIPLLLSHLVLGCNQIILSFLRKRQNKVSDIQLPDYYLVVLTFHSQPLLRQPSFFCHLLKQLFFKIPNPGTWPWEPFWSPLNQPGDLWPEVGLCMACTKSSLSCMPPALPTSGHTFLDCPSLPSHCPAAPWPGLPAGLTAPATPASSPPAGRENCNNSLQKGVI